MSLAEVTSTLNDNKNSEVRELESWAQEAAGENIIEPSLDTLTRNLEELFDCEAATLFSYDKLQRQLYSRNLKNDEVPEIRLDLSTYNIAGFVAATGNPLNIKNVQSKSELAKNNRELLHDGSWDEKLDFETRSMLVIPLSCNGTFMGVMELINKISDTHFSDSDFLKARAISSLMAQVLVRLDKVHPSQNSAKHNPKIIAQAIQSIRTMDEVYIGLAPLLTSMFDAEVVRIYTLNQDKKELFTRANSEAGVLEHRLPLTRENLIGLSALEERIINVRNAQDDGELKKLHGELTPAGQEEGSTLVIPLPHRDRVVGVLQLSGKQKKSAFTSKDEKNAVMISESLSHAIVSRKNALEAKPAPYGLLVQNGLLSDDEFKEFQKRAEASKEHIETILRRDHFILATDIGKSLEYFYSTPYFAYDAELTLPDPEPWKMKKERLKEQNWVPIRHQDKQVVILAGNPKDPAMREYVENVFQGYEVEYRVGLSDDIKTYFEKMAPHIKDEPEPVPEPAPGATPTEQEITQMTSSSSTGAAQAAGGTSPAPSAGSNDQNGAGANSVVSLFNETLNIAGNKGVTDIYIEPNMETKNILVRLRKDGACRIFDEIPGQHKAKLIEHIKSLAKLDVQKTNMPQSGQVEWSDSGLKLGLNVVVLPTIGDNEDVTIQVTRLSKPRPQYMALDAMHFSEPNLARIHASLAKSQGLILVAGPEGAGKTTTLHAFLGRLNSPEKKVVTAEDPVDIVQNGIRQLLISPESGLNFASAMKMLVMGSPDVIMVGDLPDSETLSAGMEGAANHLVLSAVPAPTATGTLATLRDALKADNQKLAETLTMVVALKQVTALCPDCKEDYHPTQQEFDQLAEFYGKKYFPELGVEYNDKLMFKKPVGCKQCLFSGYGEKTQLQEVLVVTAEMKALIASGAPEDKVLAQAIKDEMITLNQDGVYKVFTGDCDFKQVEAAFKAGA